MADPRKHEWDICRQFMAGRSVHELAVKFGCLEEQIEEVLRGNTLDLVKRDMWMQVEGIPHI